MRVVKRRLILCALRVAAGALIAWQVWDYNTKGVSPPLPIVGEGWVTKLKGIEKFTDHPKNRWDKIMSLTLHEEAGGYNIVGEGAMLYAGGQMAYIHRDFMRDWSMGSPWGEPIGPEGLIDQIRTQLQKLPPSVVREPTAERKLVVHHFEKDQVSAFGYDLANLPQEVLDLLRFAKVPYRAWTLPIPPDGSWQANQGADGTLMALRTRNQLLTSAEGGVGCQDS